MSNLNKSITKFGKRIFIQKITKIFFRISFFDKKYLENDWLNIIKFVIK